MTNLMSGLKPTSGRRGGVGSGEPVVRNRVFGVSGFMSTFNLPTLVVLLRSLVMKRKHCN